MDITGMNYVLARCKKHNLCQHAEVLGMRLCVQCLVEKAINTGEVLKPKEIHLEAD
jgi:hypothetical protein